MEIVKSDRKISDIVHESSIVKYVIDESDERWLSLAFNDLQLQSLTKIINGVVNYVENKHINLNFKKLTEDAIEPSYAHEGEDACFDIYTSEEITIEAKDTKPVKTGIAFEIPQGYKLSIKNRSGITIKGLDGNYVRVMLGTVDQGYRNEVMIMVYNQEAHAVTIPKHTKLAQVELEKVAIAKLNRVEEFSSETKRGLDGFGSTGK